MQENASSTGSEELTGIKNLEEEFDAEVAKELAQAFLDDSQPAIAKMEKAIADGDQESLRSAAHMLKGCARALQATPCEKAAGLVENNARDGDMTSAAGNLVSLMEIYNETANSLRQYISCP